MMSQNNQRAVVIGASMAGLLAARVLADHFRRVTVVERDRLPIGPEPRKGLPQARHVHILLWRGQVILDRLFPGLQGELGQAGAPRVDWIGDARWYSFGGKPRKEL
jgi:choline dehydrogenase-like flavoprotein